MDSRKIKFKIDIKDLKNQYDLEVGTTIEFKSSTYPWRIKLIEEVKESGKYRKFKVGNGVYYTEDYLINRLNNKEAIIIET